MPNAQGSITFVNESLYEVSINRGSDFVMDLAPRLSSTQNTAPGEMWTIIDKGTGREVDTVTGTDGDQTCHIKFKRSRGEPIKSGSGGN